jgi:hypothetical protein
MKVNSVCVLRLIKKNIYIRIRLDVNVKLINIKSQVSNVINK